ncbi:MAG: ArsR/SmtB family transcription factor [Sphingorhabdus sp.]
MKPDELDEALRALSHKERRMFLDLCASERRAAGEIAEASSLSLATVSEHLKVLRKTGLVTLEKEGRYWFYQTDRAQLDMIVEALGSLRKGMD